MRKLLILTAACCLSLSCAAGGEDEIVVTREQLGSDWPLRVNSARLSCSDQGAVLRLGQKRYALDAAALAQGLPDARQVAARGPGDSGAPADLAPLREAARPVPRSRPGARRRPGLARRAWDSRFRSPDRPR